MELRDQLSTALENQTTKSIGSFGSDDFRPNDHHHHHEKVWQIVSENYCPNRCILTIKSFYFNDFYICDFYDLQTLSVLSDSGSHHSSENEISRNGGVRKVVGSSSSGVSSDLSDPDSDGGHDDDRGQILQNRNHDDDVDKKDSSHPLILPKQGNKRMKDNIMVEISTQTKDDKSSVTMLAMEMDKLSLPSCYHEESQFSKTSLSEKQDVTDLQENMNFIALREDYQLLQEQKRNLELDIKSFKQDTESNVAVGKENSKRIIKLQGIEYSLRSQLEELDTKYTALKEKNRILVEEKCELEEAENDSRLQAQR